ncbi:Retrovirus-related Pol polyprotein from transposon TNT 1-94 [Araneus ventricosus]|uniref:Retrovirus-related Pol polyprotein from transposon TNT 1-94 n=1 Tax=Araneus ventricosus TaxID=182803 RepID=A0A4Y2R084_ARAVE|nr:Retrovirus-related Pol polyprotein from transposon TNT 1-94 [Araneus ventricosus]
MGVAERNNRTLVERARSMLADAHLDRRYWAEAVQTANHCKNIYPTVAATGTTPYEKWSGDKPNLEYLRVFGCRAFVHIPKEKRTKWDAKAKEMMFIGGSIACSSDNEDNHDSNIETEGLVNDNSEIDSSGHITTINDNNTNMDNAVDNALPVLTRPYRETRLPNRYQDFDMNGMPDLQMPNLNRMCFVKALAAMQNDCCLEPKTIDEAVNGVDRNHWKDSISETISGHIKNKTWEIVDEPENKNIVRHFLKI